jgi:catechol 2,3-dioxygenase-like lactoylglutathione lyase family enzyme
MNRVVTGTLSALVLTCIATAASVAQTANPTPRAVIPEGQSHIVGVAKLIVKDAAASKAYYEQYFGMKEVAYYSGKDVYVEPIMGYGQGARLALFQPLAEAELKKPAAPVALIYTPQFEKMVKELEDAQQRVFRLPAAQSGPFKIAIARDPSGNAIEILARDDKPVEVGGSKLIVDDRAKAEEWFAQVFDAKPGPRYVTAGYDEVLMLFGEGPFLALYQPKNEAPLPKSQFPVVAIYSRDFDNVLKRVQEIGLGYREVKTSSPNLRIVIAKDPAGNGVEIISSR